MQAIDIQNYRKLFVAPTGKFRLITIENCIEAEPVIRDFRSLRKAKSAAHREATLGKEAEIYDSKGDFVFRGRATHG